MTVNKFPMTLFGANALREELHELKTVKRPQISKSIAEARSHGDLRENAEYHAAKEQQGFVEGRIQEIEHKLAHSQIIDIQHLAKQNKTEKVVFGVTVVISNVNTGETVRYKIVGEDEADLEQGKISCTSPIARELIGKELGDSVEVKAPGGNVNYEIDEILFV